MIASALGTWFTQKVVSSMDMESSPTVLHSLLEEGKLGVIRRLGNWGVVSGKLGKGTTKFPVRVCT